MSDDFKARVRKYAQESQSVVQYASSEAATRQYLVLPFLQLLGYNPVDPNEVRPEVEASFADKFRNKVDYAIYKDNVAVIAIETKAAGSMNEAQRGELRGYFNAVHTVKLGILTDGLAYELFTDTGMENMMDERPFARIVLADIAEGNVDEAAWDAILGLRKSVFDPAGVGADAKRKIYVSNYCSALESLVATPTEPFIRMLMDASGVEGKRTSKLLQEHTPVIQESIGHFLDKVILDRVGFTTRDDIVRKEAPSPPAEAPAEPESDGDSAPGITTTKTEMAVFEYAVRRLAFLVKDPGLFCKLQDIDWADYRTLFCVFYKQKNKGRLFNYREGQNPAHVFEFIPLGTTIETDCLEDIDRDLLGAFMQRIEELG